MAWRQFSVTYVLVLSVTYVLVPNRYRVSSVAEIRDFGSSGNDSRMA